MRALRSNHEGVSRSITGPHSLDQLSLSAASFTVCKGAKRRGGGFPQVAFVMVRSLVRRRRYGVEIAWR